MALVKPTNRLIPVDPKSSCSGMRFPVLGCIIYKTGLAILTKYIARWVGVRGRGNQIHKRAGEMLS